MAELLKFIDKVCTENGLSYWISFGTLLGAVRHGGFIPWDDDTDICMPIEDLRKFMQIMLYNNPSEEFVLQCHENDPGYNRSQWVVLRDLKSEYIQEGKYSKFHNKLKYRGLQVDIFPVEENVSMGLKKCVDLSQSLFITKPTVSDKWCYIILKPFRMFIWYLLNYIIIPLCRLYKNKRYSNSYIISYGVPIPFKYIGEKSDIYPLQRISFENKELNAPKEYDNYLSNLYGDWRKVPSPSEIKTHNVKVIFK
jgi:lipopolysaccharide cholinephosphotransferase